MTMFRDARVRDCIEGQTEHWISMVTRTNTGREIDYLHCVYCKTHWEIRQVVGMVTLDVPITETEIETRSIPSRAS
jgi:hypothetical protein